MHMIYMNESKYYAKSDLTFDSNLAQTFAKKKKGN